LNFLTFVNNKAVLGGIKGMSFWAFFEEFF